MGGWVLSIVGIVVVGVLIDIILPDGNIQKYIKGVFGLIAICVIVAPIPKLLNKEIDIKEFFVYDSSSVIEVDTLFLDNAKKSFKNNIESKIKEVLIDKGIDVGYIKIYIKELSIYDIEYISIYLLNYSEEMDDATRKIIKTIYNDVELKIYGT